MKPVEHFLSQLDKMDRGGLEAGSDEAAIRGFTDLAAPVIGRDSAGDLCSALLEVLREKPGPEGRSSYVTLGYAAAFLLGEFDDDSMELGAGEWEEIRNALEDAACDMDLKTLTTLMGELLERGKI
ncbi:MAG: hypothetical protein LBF63_10310 [Treponema sp.]|jgi:hypothetical protein|nr:hypothetical protein [Treponema sp.]